MTTTSPHPAMHTGSTSLELSHSPMSEVWQVGVQGSDAMEGSSGISVSHPMPAETVAMCTHVEAVTKAPRRVGMHRPQQFGAALASAWQLCRSVVTAQNRTTLVMAEVVQAVHL